MNWVFKLLILLILLTVAGVVYAQTTATPLQLGFLATSGCPSGASVCFLPYSVTNPLPVISQ